MKLDILFVALHFHLIWQLYIIYKYFLVKDNIWLYLKTDYMEVIEMSTYITQTAGAWNRVIDLKQ